MKVKIIKIEPLSEEGSSVTAEINRTTLLLFDPEEKITESQLKKVVDAKICGLEGTVEKASGPQKFDRKKIIAKVVEKDFDYAVLDCGLFTFEYLINLGDEEKFVVGGFIQLENPRLDLIMQER